MSGLKIVKGGKLKLSYWDPNTQTDKIEDVTERAITKLFYPCSIDKGVTLRDIFLLLNTNSAMFSVIYPYWVEEYIDEALLSEPNKLDEIVDTQVEYLQLSWNYHYQTYKGKEELQGMDRPDLYGIGPKLLEDYENFKKGDRIRYSLSFSSTKELVDLPIKLKQDLEIVDLNLDLLPDPKTINTPTALYDGVTYTLGSILEGILYEISFHGSPQSRDKGKLELLKQVEMVKSGEGELIDFDLKSLIP